MKMQTLIDFVTSIFLLNDFMIISISRRAYELIKDVDRLGDEIVNMNHKY